MDNVTHAITGIIAAEAVVHLRRRLGDDVTPAWARAAWVISALGQNMADADAIYTGITEGPLGYLLHHRGHTHTLVLAPVMALVAYAIGGNATRAWREGATRADRLWLAALALAGAVGHLLLDLSNDYGIHPFWPLDDGWIYGDTIFIVEPLFWAATLPILVRASRSVVARATFERCCSASWRSPGSPATRRGRPRSPSRCSRRSLRSSPGGPARRRASPLRSGRAARSSAPSRPGAQRPAPTCATRWRARTPPSPPSTSRAPRVLRPPSAGKRSPCSARRTGSTR